MSNITIIAKDGQQRVVDLDAPLLTLGRGPDNTIPVLDDLVSKYHCQIVRISDERFLLRDCGSRNGTTCGGKSVTERLLGDGDEFVMGQTRVRFASTFDARSSESSAASMPASPLEPSTVIGMHPIQIDPARDLPGAVRSLEEGLSHMGARLNELASLVARSGGGKTEEVDRTVRSLVEARGEQSRLTRDLFTRTFRVDELLRDHEERLCRFEQERISHIRQIGEQARALADMMERVALLERGGGVSRLRATRLTVPVPVVSPQGVAEQDGRREAPLGSDIATPASDPAASPRDESDDLAVLVARAARK